MIKQNHTVWCRDYNNNMETSHSVVIIHLNGMKFSMSFHYKQTAIA